jgi:hypothetical protein
METEDRAVGEVGDVADVGEDGGRVGDAGEEAKSDVNASRRINKKIY